MGRAASRLRLRRGLLCLSGAGGPLCRAGRLRPVGSRRSGVAFRGGRSALPLRDGPRCFAPSSSAGAALPLRGGRSALSGRAAAPGRVPAVRRGPPGRAVRAAPSGRAVASGRAALLRAFVSGGGCSASPGRAVRSVGPGGCARSGPGGPAWPSGVGGPFRRGLLCLSGAGGPLCRAGRLRPVGSRPSGVALRGGRSVLLLWAPAVRRGPAGPGRGLRSSGPGVAGDARGQAAQGASSAGGRVRLGVPSARSGSWLRRGGAG
ncbi:hypothetical protein ABIA32_002009 [Streptacidiphilus sp. MAP12-20]